MILDTISNLKSYISCHPDFGDVISFIDKTDLQSLSEGKHLVNHSGTFVSVNEYEPKLESDCFIECHRKYIDIQMITKGEEFIGYCPVSDCSAEHYNEDADLQKLSGTVSYISMQLGTFAIFFPHDGHMPCIRKDGKSATVKKIVFKIPVSRTSGDCI